MSTTLTHFFAMHAFATAATLLPLVWWARWLRRRPRAWRGWRRATAVLVTLGVCYLVSIADAAHRLAREATAIGAEPENIATAQMHLLQTLVAGFVALVALVLALFVGTAIELLRTPRNPRPAVLDPANASAAFRAPPAPPR